MCNEIANLINGLRMDLFIGQLFPRKKVSRVKVKFLIEYWKGVRVLIAILIDQKLLNLDCHRLNAFLGKTKQFLSISSLQKSCLETMDCLRLIDIFRIKPLNPN
jgi:hypothetical protein